MNRARDAILLVALTCALTVLGCLLLYTVDNKYTAKGPQPSEGLLTLGESELARHPVLFLTEGWAYYSDTMLTPESYRRDRPSPTAYIYIGQYGGFEAGRLDSGLGADVLAQTPHGCASYRLCITLPQEPRDYTLELPEIFSAYRLYIDGRQVAAMGQPEPEAYRPETGNGTVSFTAAGTVELIFAVSDYSHLYSGMVYPPAFGEPRAVARLLSGRLVFRSLIVAFALAIGLISVLTGLLSGRNRLAMLYGLLCLCFIGLTGYTIQSTVATRHPALNSVELVSFCAMLVVVMLLQGTLHRFMGRVGRCFVAFGVAMCLFSAVLPLLLPGGSLAMMAVYSLAVSAYELLTAGFITLTALLALYHGQPHSKVLLVGFLALDAALVMDRALPLYEPIVGGWFYELAGFVMVLCIGGAVGLEFAEKYRESAVLMERQAGMERLAGMQRASYELLLERVEETKAARHDLRHHFTVMDGLLSEREYERLRAYIAQYRAASRPDEPLGYTQNRVADVLLRHYAQAAKAQGITFTVNADLPARLTMDDADLCALLANLLENAVEACGRIDHAGAFVSVWLTQVGAALSIQVENSAQAATMRAGAGGFQSSKAEGRTGYGLSSISSVAKRYDGEAEFRFDSEAGVFISTVLLQLADVSLPAR